jgi:hypothetical protein
VGRGDRPYHHDPAGTGVEDLGQPLGVDAADREPRFVATEFGGGAYQLQARRRAARLGRGGPAGADAEIVGAGGPKTGHGRRNLVPVMGGQSDQGGRPDDLAGRVQRQIALTQVQRVGTRRAGDVGAVVDRKQGAMPAGRVRQGFARGQLVARLERAEPLLTDRTLVAQLDDVHSAAQRGVRELGQVATLAPRVGAQIQVRGRETGSGPAAIDTEVHTATLAR